MTKQEAVSHFETVAKLAKTLGISTQAIYDWPETVPQLRQFQLERITNGKLKAKAPLPNQAA